MICFKKERKKSKKITNSRSPGYWRNKYEKAAALAESNGRKLLMVRNINNSLERIIESLRNNRWPATSPGFVLSTESDTKHSIHLTCDLNHDLVCGNIAVLIRADPQDMYCGIPGYIEIQPGYDFTVVLPDGTRVSTDDNGVAVIDTKDQKVLYISQTAYQTNVPEGFNRYLNASDLIEQFIDFAATRRISKDDFLAMPLLYFIKWIVMNAAKEEGMLIPDDAESLEIDLKKLESIVATQGDD